MSYPVATGQADSLNRVYFWKENEIFQRITFYEEVGLGFHPASLKVFNDYLTKYQIDLDAAVAILTQHHPDLDSNLIRLTLYYLILLELSLYDQMDAKQDLAAARSSDSLDYQLYWDAFVDWTSPLNAYSGSLVGNYAWQLSSAVLLDVGNQGFGPVQIIPNLLQKAYEDERVYPAFATHLSADKLATQDARLNTILNPRDSIYAKAMTLDLQLYQFTDKPTWTIPIDHAPYLPDVDDAHQFAVVYAANCLVQKPESGDHLKTKWVDGQYGVFMKSLAVLADVTNVPFPFASFGVFTASHCPGESVGTYAGYFYREGDTVKHCLRTSKLYPSAPFQP